MQVSSADTIPDLSGKTAFVTGATGGIGLETARMLANAGAYVILAGRNAEKGIAAMRDIAAGAPKGKIEFERCDMADLADVAAAAARTMATHASIDILINNAGVMMPPKRQRTADGFELQFGTNHLGHFALTGHLLPMLRSSNARIVNVSSNAAQGGKINFADLQGEARYSPMGAYAQSKLANLLFGHRLQQLSDSEGWNLTVQAAHPGFAATGLIPSGMGQSLSGRIAGFISGFVAQSASDGALPTVAAATEPSLPKLSYIGPDGRGGWRGKPIAVKLPKTAEDHETARRLWEVSENLTEVRFVV
jgi:NAD(P)-dependent dehydrogenase (short-subunit alcohol dehydrogenase family)